MSNIISLKIPRNTAKLREVALQKVKDAILLGHFQPGQRLIERSLCDELNVSRTVVREIIRYLESEGLVENTSNKGPSVSILDWETTEQIYKIRLMIESEVASECAKNADKKTKELLHNALQDIKKNYKSDNIISLIESTSKFYKIIFDTTNQEVAWDVVHRLNGKINRLRAITLSTKNRHISGYKKMANIYDAIAKNDPVKTKKMVEEHIGEVMEIAYKALQQKTKKTQKKQKNGYWIADVTITNSKKYQKYVTITPDIIKKYGGKFITRGGEKKQLEGDTNERHVIIEFKSTEQALKCYNSPEYKEARKLRKDACKVNVTIVEGT